MAPVETIPSLLDQVKTCVRKLAIEQSREMCLICNMMVAPPLMIKEDFFMPKFKFTAKHLTFSAVAIAMAAVLSEIKFLDLPFGGSITLCSMFFITFIGYVYGVKVGLVAGLAYGLLQFVLGPYFVTVPQVLVDYPFAFGALGLSGLLANKKWGLQTGYVLGIVGRLFFAWLSGVVFFAEYAEGTGLIAPVYSLVYNGSYIAVEGVVTLIIISLPPVTKAINHVKKMMME